ncbi:MAG: glycosyltransferase family 9 protein [Elusimicrobiota bacterium]
MRVLILRLSSLGDILLAACVFEEIKRANPDSWLACVVKPRYQGVAASIAALDEVVAYQGFSKTLGVLRKERWDIVIDLHGVWRSRSLAAFLVAGKKVIYDKDIWARYGMVWLGRRRPASHVLDRYARAFEAAGLKLSREAQGRGELFKPFVFQQAAEMCRELGLDPGKDFLIGLAPGAKWATKRWPAYRFAELGRRLLARYPAARLLLLGSPEERALCQEIVGFLTDAGPSKVFNLAGSAEPVTLAGLVKSLKILIANDSGIMHVGWIQGVPTVAIFGPTVGGFGFFPRGKKSMVVEKQDLKCRPCSLHGNAVCPRGHFLCMELIGVNEALIACETALV